MKKLFAGMVVSMMIVGLMGTTVFAAGSPTSGTVKTALEQESSALSGKITGISATDSSGCTVILKQSDVDTTTMRFGQSEAKNLSSDASVLAMTDLSVASGSTTGTVTVKLTVNGLSQAVSKGDSIRVYHYNSKTGVWEDLSSKATVKDGAVVVTMTSFSPIMVVSVPATSTGQSGNNPTDTSDNQGNQSEDTDGAYEYTQGYNDGYEDGVNSVSNTNSPASSTDKSNPTKKSTAKSNTSKSGTSKSGASKSGTSKSSSVKSSSAKKSSSGGSSKSSSTARYTSYSTGNNTSSYTNTSTTSPKTGASLPALPLVAMFAFAGLLVCVKKGHNQ